MRILIVIVDSYGNLTIRVIEITICEKLSLHCGVGLSIMGKELDFLIYSNLFKPSNLKNTMRCLIYDFCENYQKCSETCNDDLEAEEYCGKRREYKDALSERVNYNLLEAIDKSRFDRD